jgi:hypothetical protein
MPDLNLAGSAVQPYISEEFIQGKVITIYRSL